MIRAHSIVVAAIVAFTLLAPSPAHPAQAGPPYLLGDVDENLLLQSADAQPILDALVENTTADLPAQGDVNLDGQVDITDAVLIGQATSGDIPGLPPEPPDPLPPPASTDSIRINSAEIYPRDEGFVRLWTGFVRRPGVGGYHITVSYDPDVIVVTECRASSRVGACEIDQSGVIRIAGSTAGQQSRTGNVTLAWLTVECRDAEGTSELTLLSEEFVDYTAGAPQSIDAPIMGGTITCSEDVPPFVMPTPLPDTGPSVVHQFSIEDATVAPDEVFDVAITAVGDEPGFRGFTILLPYPSGLLAPIECAAAGDFECTVDYEPNIIRLSGQSDEPMTGEMSLATLTFQAAGYNCQTTLWLSRALFIRGEPSRAFGREVTDGTVTIEGGPDLPSGDVNCDGVSAVDAALVLQVSAGLINDLRSPTHGDVNQDRRLGAVDATLILQYVAGLLESLPP